MTATDFPKNSEDPGLTPDFYNEMRLNATYTFFDEKKLFSKGNF